MKIKDTINNEVETYITRDGIPLTTSQQDVLKKMIEWSDKDNTSVVFTLQGFAGTGKTTLVDSYIQEVIKKYKYYNKGNICVTAPTHKAKKVISVKTKTAGRTLQSLLGLRPNVELDKYNINMPVFAQLAEELIQDYKLIIIDECSMVNYELDRLTRTRAQFWNVKILYVGDPYQLPPINESMSSTFTKVKNLEVLTEIVRQEKGNPLLELIAKVRNDIINGTNKSIIDLSKPNEDINNKGEGYIITNDKKKLEGTITDLFRDSPAYDDDKEFVKYIGWTNKNVNDWNDFIRNIIFTNPKLIVTHDDLLMAYKGIINKSGNLSLINSEEYTIKTYAPKINKYGIKGYQLVLIPAKGKDIQIFIVAPGGHKLFTELHIEKLNEAKQNSRAWKQYYEFKNDNLVMSDITKDGILVVKKDLDYGYCCTVHKTQGSTFKNVVINGKNLNKCKKRDDRLRLWYVALSRASKQANIFI